MKLSGLLYIPAALLLAASCMGEAYDMAYVPGDALYDRVVYGEGFPLLPGGDKYEEFSDNPFITASSQPVSTFSVDADGASYANMKAYIRAGYLPAVNSVRVEEFLNYFTFDYAEPDGDETLAVNSEVSDCPWAEGHKLLRLGLKGKSLAENEMPAANYVFLVDVSGSMNSKDKLPLLKAGLMTMTDYLRPTDRISIITYSGEVRTLLESTLASDAATIKNAISQLQASGSTNGGSAIQKAYREALDNYIEGGNNRIILGTDGDFNVGVTSTDSLVSIVSANAAKGIYLTACGFGRGNLNDAMMEKISNSGNGTYEYIADEGDLTKVFVNERSKFCSVANDAKVQVIFDTTRVYSYRLIGYENRVMDGEDFEDDAKDAGEIGAGQTVTALYELVLKDNVQPEDALGTFNVRYKETLGGESRPLSSSFRCTSAGAALSSEMSFAAGVASYAMLLRESPYKGDSTFKMAASLVSAGLEFDPFGYRSDLTGLITAAARYNRD